MYRTGLISYMIYPENEHKPWRGLWIGKAWRPRRCRRGLHVSTRLPGQSSSPSSLGGSTGGGGGGGLGCLPVMTLGSATTSATMVTIIGTPAPAFSNNVYSSHQQAAFAAE